MIMPIPGREYHVLILVLVDVGLGRRAFHARPRRVDVLILVLVDVGLGLEQLLRLCQYYEES